MMKCAANDDLLRRMCADAICQPALVVPLVERADNFDETKFHFVHFCRDSESFPFWTSTDNLRCQPVDENHAWTTSAHGLFMSIFQTKFIRRATKWNKQFFQGKSTFLGGQQSPHAHGAGWWCT